MKPHCVHYILYRDIGYGTLCSTALSIGVVSARGSIDALINEELIQMTDKEGFDPVVAQQKIDELCG
ncbi:MAG: hypothetical protein K8R07_01675 [Desulfobacterales bacterium]|nr:hypothetical protein [Desulfobacterales bacterium]